MQWVADLQSLDLKGKNSKLIPPKTFQVCFNSRASDTLILLESKRGIALLRLGGR